MGLMVKIFPLEIPTALYATASYTELATFIVRCPLPSKRLLPYVGCQIQHKNWIVQLGIELWCPSNMQSWTPPGYGE